ncbi:MAG: AAA family ATPase [Planctomycetes bacterium]|nr:AAA family ATPase [Planctomycetota bacterium]
MYCSHFGLHRPPFNNTPDPTFYFSTPEHEEALATLHYATEERKGFVLITGEVGAGKTLTGRMFLRQIEQQAETAVITNTHLSGRQLLAAICSEFGLNPPPQAGNLELSQLLQEFLLEQFARNRYVVVLIDEAQNLPDEAFEEIRMLGNLEADDAKLLQVCILGQPELRGRFSQAQMRQLDQRLFRRFHLKALSSDQTRQYIQHRLRIAGYAGTGLFTDEAIDAIYLASKGVPRLINQISDAALLACYADRREIVDIRTIDEVCERVTGAEFDAEEMDNRQEAARSVSRLAAGDDSAAQGTGVAVPQRELAAGLGKLAGSIQECVETVLEGQGTTPSEIAAEVPEWNDGLSSSGVSDGSSNEPRASDSEIAKRRQKAREELDRLARTDFSVETNGQAHPSDRTISPGAGNGGDSKAKDAARSPLHRRRLAGFMDAVKQKCSRVTDDAKAGQKEMPAGSMSQSRNTQELRQRDSETLADRKQEIDALKRRLADSERAIVNLSRHVTSQWNATREALNTVERKAVSSDEFEHLRTLHETSTSEVERRLAENTASLRQLSNSVEEQLRSVNGGTLPEVQALSKRLIEQAQQLHELRKRTLAQNASVAQILSEMKSQLVGRAELEEVRAAQAETARKILERIDRNRDDAQEILDNLEERYLGLRDQIEAVIASKAEASNLVDVQARHEADFGELLNALGKQRQELENKLEQMVADWKQTQKALDDLAAQAGDKRELDQIRRRQAADAGRILEMLAAHRRDVEHLARDLDRRAGDLLARLNALPKDIATAEQLQGIRAAYTEQITDLTARLAACEAGFEKSRAIHERGLQAVAGKTLETARRVSILEEKGRPRRIRLELSPQAGIELGDVVAAAQDHRDALRGDIEEARKTAVDLREMSSTIQEAIRAWQASVEESWDNAQSFLQDWQGKAVEAKSEADRMLQRWQSEATEAKGEADRSLQRWQSGTKEVSEEAERLKASAKMAAEILQRMRQCHNAIDAKLDSEEWRVEIAKAETTAARLEQVVAAGRTICQQIVSRTEQSKNELSAHLAECKKELAERLAQFAAEQRQMDQVIESRRRMLSNIARSAASLAEVIEAGRQFDEKRQPSPPAGLAAKPPAIESREPEVDTVEQIHWPRFRTHQTQTQAQAG